VRVRDEHGSTIYADPLRLEFRSGKFRRGNANADGKTDLSDALYVLGFLFLGGPGPSCLKAADTDDSGELDLTDAVYLLSYLFLGGPAPPEPYPACGLDPTVDELTCNAFAVCE
jgi:hypothetical protein